VTGQKTLLLKTLADAVSNRPRCNRSLNPQIFDKTWSKTSDNVTAPLLLGLLLRLFKDSLFSTTTPDQNLSPTDRRHCDWAINKRDWGWLLHWLRWKPHFLKSAKISIALVRFYTLIIIAAQAKYIFLYLCFWSSENNYLCTCNMYFCKNNGRCPDGWFVKRFFKVSGACQTSYDVRYPGGRRWNRTILNFNDKSSSARPMSFYPQWPYLTQYGRRGILSRT